MSLYVAGRATNLGVGEQATLANGTLGGAPYTTPAVAIGRDASGFDSATVFNHTNALATVQVADVDADANFLPLVDPDSGLAVTVATGTAGTFRCIGPFARLSFPTDPGASGAAIFGR